MNQQNPKRAYTAEEIARLEAEAVAALQKGETPSTTGTTCLAPGRSG